MNTAPPTPCDNVTKERIRAIVCAAGACRAGFAEAGEVDSSDRTLYHKWQSEGGHAAMAYLEKYDDVRFDTRRLLDGAKTVISCAFDYRQPQRHRLFADYALGEDYHDVIRRRLTAAAAEICRLYGGEARVCVDTAPVRERYWAAHAGVGFTGCNGHIFVDGIGSKVFLAEIIWTQPVSPDPSRLGESCPRCGRCRTACPGAALSEGAVDSRNCRSYLTIEHRGDLPAGLTLDGRIYGCDICQDVCPLNRTGGFSTIDEFAPHDALMKLTADGIRSLDEKTYKEVFGHSAIRRAKLAGLLRNAAKADPTADNN